MKPVRDLVPRPQARVKVEPEPSVSSVLAPLFGTGLLGRAASSLVGAGLKAVAGLVREAVRSSDELHAAASSAVARDARVMAALGGQVHCGPPTAVSSSSQSINGITTSVTSLQFPVESSVGRVARVSVTARNGVSDIRVQLPTGDSIRVDSRGSGGGGSGGGRSSGRIIDVDAADYKIRD